MTGATDALRYIGAGLGFRVVPLRPNSKLPLTPHGVKDASDDPKLIAHWWNRWPSANVGLAIPDSIRVLDVDLRTLGDESLDACVEAHGPLPLTMQQRTGSGGSHYLFTVPHGTKTRTKVPDCPGLEVLGGLDEDGRPKKFIVVANSAVPLDAKGNRNPNGGRYSWVTPRGTPIAPMPAWLLDDVREEPRAQAVERVAPTSPDAFERARAYMAKVAPAISGSNGHNHTFIVAQKLVRGFVLSDGEALALLREWNQSCVPPWSEHELRRKVQQARERGAMACGDLLERRRTG